jgi:hypothetical protein
MVREGVQAAWTITFISPAAQDDFSVHSDALRKTADLPDS